MANLKRECEDDQLSMAQCPNWTLYQINTNKNTEENTNPGQDIHTIVWDHHVGTLYNHLYLIYIYIIVIYCLLTTAYMIV